MADKPVQDFKARIRQLTRRSGRRSMEQVLEKLRAWNFSIFALREAVMLAFAGTVVAVPCCWFLAADAPA